MEAELHWHWEQNLVSVTPPLRVNIGDCKWGMFKVSFASSSAEGGHTRYRCGNAKPQSGRPQTPAPPCHFSVHVRPGPCLAQIEALDTALAKRVDELLKMGPSGASPLRIGDCSLTYKGIISRKPPYPDSVFVRYRPEVAGVYDVSESKMKQSCDGVQATEGNLQVTIDPHHMPPPKSQQQAVKKGDHVACIATIHNLHINREDMTLTPKLYTRFIVLDPDKVVPNRYAHVEDPSARKRRRFVSISQWGDIPDSVSNTKSKSSKQNVNI